MEIGIWGRPDLFSPLCLNDRWTTEIANRLKVGDMQERKITITQKHKDKKMAEEKKNMPTVDDQYQRLIEARNFHYENLNKWLTFFYVAIAAIFAGYCTLRSAKDGNPNLEIIVMAVLYLVSLCAYLSCKGYYYWENQWIMLLHYFERKHLTDKEEKIVRIYSVFANKDLLDNTTHPVKGANISTTKVALLMTLMMTILWGAMLIFGILEEKQICLPENETCAVIFSLLGSIVGTFLFVIIGKISLASNLEGLDDLCLTGKNSEEKN